MTTLRTVAAGLARRVARVRPAIRDAEAALEANDPERALEVTDAAIRARPGDRVLLAVRRRAFAARGDQTGVAATIAAQRRAGSDDNHALAVTERRLHGDLAETDPRWRPRLLGPRQPIEPRSDRVVLHLLKESRPQRQNGFTMRSHDNLLAQRAAGSEPVVVTALGSRAWSGASVTATEQVDGHPPSPHRPGAGYPPTARSTAISRTTHGARRSSPGRSGRRSSTPRRAGGATSRRWSASRWATTSSCRWSTRSARCSTVRRPPARVDPRQTRPRRANGIGAGTRPRCGRCSPRTPWSRWPRR